MLVRKYESSDLSQMMNIWNEVVIDGNAFPQDTPLDLKTAEAFFKEQTFTAVAQDDGGEIVGLYILHPNNVGRCSHICNASYAVAKGKRGMNIGESLVKHSLKMGKECGFMILQFNAVVATNYSARHLYEKLGFVPLGTIPSGFKLKNGEYEDICPYYHTL